MSLFQNDAITFDLDNTENWRIQINDTDQDGVPIPHTADKLIAAWTDATGLPVFTAESGVAGPATITLANGTTNGILITVVWSTVSTLPAGQYFASLIVQRDPDNREKICDLVVRHEVRS